MTPRSVRLLLAILLVGFAVPRPVLAEPSDTPVEEARALFKKGDYRGALDVLERAQATHPDPRQFWNMAACETKLGHRAKAMVYVERYLSSATELTRDERTTAAQFLTSAKAYVGVVTVTSKLAGTEVYVDGDLAGTTPLAKPVFVDEGEHRVRFVRSGYVPVERSERVIGGTELEWGVELEPVSPESRPLSPGEPMPRSSSRRVGPLVLGGAGVVLAGVGGVLVGLSLARASELRDDCANVCPPSRWQKFRTMQITGDVLLGAGGAALAGAAIWFALGPRAERRSAWIAPGAGGFVFGATL